MSKINCKFGVQGKTAVRARACAYDPRELNKHNIIITTIIIISNIKNCYSSFQRLSFRSALHTFLEDSSDPLIECIFLNTTFLLVFSDLNFY